MKIKALIFPEVNKFEISELTLDRMGKDDIKVKTIIPQYLQEQKDGIKYSHCLFMKQLEKQFLMLK